MAKEGVFASGLSHQRHPGRGTDREHGTPDPGGQGHQQPLAGGHVRIHGQHGEHHRDVIDDGRDNRTHPQQDNRRQRQVAHNPRHATRLHKQLHHRLVGEQPLFAANQFQVMIHVATRLLLVHRRHPLPHGHPLPERHVEPQRQVF